MFGTTRHFVSLLLAAAMLAGCGGGGTGSSGGDKQVAGLELAQHSAWMTAGEERQLAVQAVNAAGETVEAEVVWTSSRPAQVSVDAGGKVKAVTPIGSAMIFATAGGVRSEPVFVSTVELKPGTLLLRDADIVRVAPPPAPPDGGFPGPGTRYDIWIAGQVAPAIGTVVIAAETANVSGRVVETAVEKNRVRVRLERLAMPDLLARYDVDWSIDLTSYDIVIDETLEGRQALPQRARPLAAGGLPEWKIPKEGTRSPCSASVSAKLKAKPLQVKFKGSPTIQAVSSKFDAALPPGRLRVALVGDFYLETSVGLTAEAGLTAEVVCEVLKGHIPLRFLPFPFNLLLEVPVGLGVSASGTVEVVSIDIGLSGKNGATFELGIDCTPPQPCRGLDRAERINELTPHMELASLDTQGLKIELEAQAYLLTGIDVAIGIGDAKYRYEMVEVKAGPKQKADFGTVKRQIDVVPYASDYELAFAIDIGPGKAVKDTIKELLGGEPADLSIGVSAKFPISESPRGTWAPDKTSVIPNRDKVRFDIDLTPFSTRYWLIGYNVQHIYIYKRHESEREFSFWRSLAATEPQAHFETSWEPETTDAGRNDFVVFAASALPVVRLEVASMKSVQVGCIGGTGTNRVRPMTAGGVCKEEWVGSASGEIFGAVRFDAPAPFLWEPDLTTVIGPGISALRPAKTGNFVDVYFTVWEDLGCTVTPKRFDGSSFSPSSLMSVDRNFDPPKYAWGLEIDATLTIACPGDPSFQIPIRVIAINGLGELSAQGTQMLGNVSNEFGRYTWNWRLKEPDPPSTQ